MASSFDKSLSQPPAGDAQSMPEEPVLEVVIDMGPEEPFLDEEEEAGDFSANLAETLDEEQLSMISGDLEADIANDVDSRSDWIKTYVDGLELLGLKLEDRNEPWENACGIYHPLLAEALVKFQSETMMETFPAQGPVKTQIVGEENAETREAASRVKEDMNYQLMERMVEYRPEHERMLWGLGLSGNGFKKVYMDPGLGRQVASYVPAEDVIVPYGASNIETAERVTHQLRKTPNELKILQKSGFYRDIELQDPVRIADAVEEGIAKQMGLSAENDSRYRLYETQVDLIIEDDEYRDDDDEGIALPYVVTTERASGNVLAIRRNWYPEDGLKKKRDHFVHYTYIPGFGFYAFGLIHLIGAYAKSGTSIIRQLVDAGSLANLPGGFKTKGLRVKNDDTPIGPGEFRDVDVVSGSMRDNIMPLPYKEPSAVLYQLLQTISDEGRRFANAGDLKVSDMSAQAPVGTTLAILERTLKTMSAIQARIHYAMRQEFRLLKRLIRDEAADAYDYTPDRAGPSAMQRDYDIVEILPVSDPNAATMAQKIVQYQTVIQLAQGAPEIYDMPYLHRQMLEVLGIKNASKLVPLEEEEGRKPRDPVSENMAVINGEPVKAFIIQDHEAHIAVHMAAMQDPKVMELLQKNPKAPAMMAAMQAHIAEHLAFEYRKQVEEQAGVPLPGPDAKMDPNTELEISRLQAAAAQQLLQKNQFEAQQKKNAEMAKDPIIQMQQEELKLKAGELQLKGEEQKLKMQKMQIDAAAKADELEMKGQDSELRQKQAAAQAAAKADELKLKEEQAAVQATAKADELALKERELDTREKLEALRIGAQLATDDARISAQQEEQGMRMGIDIAKEVMNSETEEARRSEDRADKEKASKEADTKPAEENDE